MSQLRVHQDLPKCPHCGTRAGTWSELALRADERQPGRMACLACGQEWDGTAAERAQAFRSEAAWVLKEKRDETRAKNRAALALAQTKMERLKRGEW